MYYKVEKEECGKGFKPRYNVGQIIDDVEVNKIKSDFSKYLYTIYETIKELKMEYYELGLFNNHKFVYSIKLTKRKTK